MAYLNKFEGCDNSMEKNESSTMDYSTERELLNFNEFNENQQVHFDYQKSETKQSIWNGDNLEIKNFNPVEKNELNKSTEETDITEHKFNYKNEKEVHFDYENKDKKQELFFDEENTDKISKLLREVEEDRFERYIKDGVISTPVEELDKIIAENSQNKNRLQLIKEVIKELENDSSDEGQKVYSKRR